MNYYFELQQGFLSELAGKRSEFLKKLESILKKTPIKRKFNNVYTYKGWKTKDVLRNELDPYLSYTLKEINSVKKTNKDIIYQVNQKNKVLQENEKLLVEKAKIIDNLNGKIEKLEAAISNYKREIDEKSRAIQQLKEIKKEKDKLLQEKEKLLIDKDGKIEKLEAAISNYKREIDEKSRAIQQLNDELYRIKNSDGYKLLTQYYRLRDFTLPSGSLRRRALKGLFNLSKGTFPKQVSKTPNEAPENKVIEKENSKITENNLEDKEKYLYVCTHNVEGEKAMDIPVIKRNPNGILKGKRILIVTPDIVGPIRSGGIGTAFYELSKALTEAGAKVTILYTLGDYSEKETIQHWMNFYKSFGVEFIPLSPGKWLYEGTPYFRQVSHRVDEWLENHEKEFDVVISPEWMGNLYYALLAKKQGLRYSSIKFITNTHGPELWAYEGNYWFPPDLDFVDRDFLERNCVNLADYAVSPSNYLFEWMKERKWAYPKKAFVIQNIFDESILKKIKEGDYKEIKRLIFFGRPEPRKGLDLFSRALELLPDEVRSKIEEVIFVGKPIKTQNFDSIEYLDSYAEKLRIPFKLYTFQRDEALKFIKSKTDALIVIPSLVENSPYTVLEALNMKVPFIATNVGGIPELIKEEFRDSVLFDPVPSALSEKIAGSLGKKPILPKPAKTPDQTKNEWVDFIRGIVDKKEEIVKIKPVSPLVTVCLTHYNRPHLLKEAIDSLKAQTYKNFEVIIVDDGSSSTEAVNYLDSLKEDFQSRGWKIIRQKNRDVGAARNTAAKNARGEFLLFMDDDNIAKPNMLETFVKAYLNSQADAYTCINILFENGSSYKDSNKVWVPAGASLGSGMFINAFGDANALVKRNVFEKIGGFTEDYGIGCEDWEFFTKLVLSGFKLEVVPEPLYYYRVTENSKLRTMDVVKSEFGRSRPLMFMDSNGLGVGLAYGIKLFLDKLNQPKPDTNQSLPEDIKSSDYYEAKDLFLKYYNQKNWFKTAVKLSAKGLGFLDRLSKKK
ncbi:MAG: glycosyltransferase [Nitrospiraceae bacterium]|nr:glycosyltransferase [Nitrospiraceae bacterium]